VCVCVVVVVGTMLCVFGGVRRMDGVCMHMCACVCVCLCVHVYVCLCERVSVYSMSNKFENGYMKYNMRRTKV